MIIKMSDKSRQFLDEYLPGVVESANKVNDVLDALEFLIERKGFAPPQYYDYNDFGRMAQKVYDDIYLSAEEADDTGG